MDKGFLEQVLVHLPGDLHIPQGDPVQTDAHQTAIQDIFRHLLTMSTGSSVLTAGMWIDQASGKMCCMWPNMAATLVQSRAWEAIHARIGTDMLRFLLIHCMCFCPHGSVLLQVSGPKPSNLPEQQHPLTPSMYHNLRYLKKAGLEPEHILLNVLSAAQLCRDIFDIQWKIGKRFKYILPGLLEMLARVPKVPWGLLLEALCPVGKDSVPRASVVSFVWNCLLKLIPRQLLGDNKWVLREWLKRSLPPGEMSQCPWRVVGCSWLPRHLHKWHGELVKLWTGWVWNKLVVPLVRNHFYVTREEGMYFRKTDWRRFCRQVDISSELGLVRLSDKLGFAHRLRVLPGSGRIISRSTRGVKYNLEVVLGALHCELEQRPEVLGATVTSFHQVFRRLSAFKSSCPQGGPFYFVKMDVQGAYHSIGQQRLWNLLLSLNILQHSHYSVHKFRVNGSRILTRVVPLGEQPRLPARAVITDLCWVSVVSREELMALIHDAIFHHLVIFGRGKYYRQTRGIPQGSILSSLLCSLYYANLLLETLQMPGCRFLRMRWVDDTLFITDNFLLAKSFYKTLMGLPDVQWNMSKTFMSSMGLTWCGLKFDPETLEVTWDYSRSSPKRLKVAGSLAKCLSLARWKFKLHVLFSPMINSRPVILFNAQQAFLYVKSRFKHVPMAFCEHFKWDADFYRMACGIMMK